MTVFTPGIVHASPPPSSGGGGGGGPVLLDSVSLVANASSVTLSGVDDGIGSLVIEGRGRAVGNFTIDGCPIGMTLNDLEDEPTLYWAISRTGQYNGNPFTSVQAQQSYPATIAIFPGSDAGTEQYGTFSHRIPFPRHTVTIGEFDDLQHHLHGLSGYIVGNTWLCLTHFVSWGVFPHEPISSVTLLANAGLSNIAAGSEFRMWGYPSS